MPTGFISPYTFVQTGMYSSGGRNWRQLPPAQPARTEPTPQGVHKPPPGGAHHHYPGRRQATQTPAHSAHTEQRHQAFISRASGAPHQLLWSPSGDTYSSKARRRRYRTAGRVLQARSEGSGLASSTLAASVARRAPAKRDQRHSAAISAHEGAHFRNWT